MIWFKKIFLSKICSPCWLFLVCFFLDAVNMDDLIPGIEFINAGDSEILAYSDQYKDISPDFLSNNSDGQNFSLLIKKHHTPHFDLDSPPRFYRCAILLTSFSTLANHKPDSSHKPDLEHILFIEYCKLLIWILFLCFSVYIVTSQLKQIVSYLPGENLFVYGSALERCLWHSKTEKDFWK